MSARRILVVDDDRDIREALADALTDSGDDVRVADGAPEALQRLERESFDAVISDVQMQPMDGRELLSRIRAIDGNLPVVLMTAYGSIDEAVGSMQDGAAHYLKKPFDVAEVRRLLKRLCPDRECHDRAGIVAESPAMRAVLERASLVADSDATISISGESGTGKEVVARFIHGCSRRAVQPFVAINCAAIPDNMLEAILFGHVRGAFTGATSDQPGKFEQAQNGTLLLDEIGEMNLALQAKLLRVVQEREVERLGGRKPVALNVRIVTTTNRDLGAEAAAGRFREDLYYRLNVFPLSLPPLRERPEDIAPLAHHLLRKHARPSGPMAVPAPAALDKLARHDWPGNVRELDNVMQRAAILSRGGTVEAAHCTFDSVARADRVSGSNSDLQTAVLDQEQRTILSALSATTGNRRAAAERLGISPRTLRYKLARLREQGIPIPQSAGAAGAG